MKQSFLLRLPEDRFKKLKKVAKNSGVSINEYLNSLLDRTSPPFSHIEGSGLEVLDKELFNLIKKSSFFSNLIGIILFGSIAKGLESDSSDCDLLFVLSHETKITRSLYSKWDDEVGDQINHLTSKGKEISPHFVNLPNDLNDVHSLWLEVAISGIVLWKNGSEIETLLQKIKQAVASGQFQRKSTHGQPYWIRKEGEKQQ